MWVIAKIKNNSFGLLTHEFKKKLSGIEIYRPTFLNETFVRNKVILKKQNLFQDYIFCYHKNFSRKNFQETFKFIKGLKYFLANSAFNQKDIVKVIKLCKKKEDEKGFIRKKFILQMNEKKISFLLGPLRNFVFDFDKIRSKYFEFKLGSFNAKVKAD